MQTENKEIIGAWKLVSFELINKTTGKIWYPYGKAPIGTLIFSADHYMSVALMADKRENFAAESIQMGTDREKIMAAETYLSYSGSWDIKDEKIFVTVHVSLLPNWIGKEHFRFFQIHGDKLFFQTPTVKQGDNESYVELSWTKI